MGQGRELFCKRGGQAHFAEKFVDVFDGCVKGGLGFSSEDLAVLLQGVAAA